MSKEKHMGLTLSNWLLVSGFLNLFAALFILSPFLQKPNTVNRKIYKITVLSTGDESVYSNKVSYFETISYGSNVCIMADGEIARTYPGGISSQVVGYYEYQPPR